MTEKLKYNFLHITPLHYSKFYNFFLLGSAQGCRFFVIPSVQTGAGKPFCQRGKNKKKRHLNLKKSFKELPFRIATVFSTKI